MEHANGNVLQMGGGDNTPMREVLMTVIAELSCQVDLSAVQTTTLHQTTDITIDVAVDCLFCDTNGTNYYTLEREHLVQINMVNTRTNNIFTQHTDPFKAERITRIMSEVTLGDDLTDEQREMTKAIVEEFVDCFTLAMSEVNPVPGVSHQLKVPAGAKFQTKIGQ